MLSETFGRSYSAATPKVCLTGAARTDGTTGVNLAVAAIAFALVLPAELPDKTAIASLVLSTRHRPAAVFAGAASALAVQVGVAVAAGRLLALLPRQPLDAVVAAMFLVGAWLLLRQSAQPEADLPAQADPRGFARAAAASFAVIVVAEFGDLTQILIANLAARYNDPLSVGVGSALALWLVAALAIAGGRGLLRIIPMRLVSRLAAAALAAMGIVSLIGALGS